MAPSDPDSRIDRVYRTVVDVLPSDLRSRALALPHEIGIAAREGGGFCEYASSLPMQELPLFAAEGAARRRALARSGALDRFRIAHYCGGFWGLLCDRLADGQVKADQALFRISRALRRRWLEALVLASGNRAVARAAVARAARRFRDAARRERHVLLVGALGVKQYVAITVDKVAWLMISAGLLLRGHATEARAMAFERCFNLLMLGLQCFDDARDAEEDARLHGHGFPQSLGVTARALFGAGRELHAIAAERSAREGFFALGAWAHRRCAEIRRLDVDGGDVQSKMSSVLLAGEMSRILGAPGREWGVRRRRGASP